MKSLANAYEHNDSRLKLRQEELKRTPPSTFNNKSVSSCSHLYVKRLQKLYTCHSTAPLHYI